MKTRNKKVEIGAEPIQIGATGKVEIPIERVMPNPEQPRTEFNQDELRGLAQSISTMGVIQPIVVEAARDDYYILHDGERRLRAAKLAGLKMIPAVIEPPLNGTAKEDRLMRALTANVQRADLGPIEEAKAYAALIEMGYTRNRIALEMGVSPARVAQRLELLKLEPPVQELIGQGKLSKDGRLIAALLDLPATAQVKMGKVLAERNATIKASVEACERLANTMATEKIGADESPALKLATKQAGEIRKPLWNAFAQVGKVPPWPLMEICVRDTCNRCSLRDSASATTCRGCALVELLRQMIGEIQ